MWIDSDKQLVESRNVDTWQLPVVNQAGEYFGNVTAQIVQPSACMVRYFKVYSSDTNRHFLLPSDTVFSIDDKVYCNVDSDRVAQLPEFIEEINREKEMEIYRIISKKPYWE